MNYCVCCNKETINPKFCSKSCSAKITNKNRLPRTVESRLKTSKSIKSIKKLVPKYTKISRCISCSGWFSGKRKTCSKECYVKNHSKNQSIRLSNCDRRNYGRGKKSYLEQSFTEWLKFQNVPFSYEVAFKNSELNKTYFADFVFNFSKTIIELDGTQHRQTTEQDSVRDDYIKIEYGYDVIRISHKEYQQKSKFNLVKSIVDKEKRLAQLVGLEPT